MGRGLLHSELLNRYTVEWLCGARALRCNRSTIQPWAPQFSSYASRKNLRQMKGLDRLLLFVRKALDLHQTTGITGVDL